MVSLRRRQVIIAGLGSVVAPAVLSAVPEKHERLVLSGRIQGLDGKPLAGAMVSVGADQAATDADGRFALVTTTRRNKPPLYRVSCNGHAAEGLVSNQRRDTEGTWRSTFGLRLV
jgi:hypothetical protein